MKSTICPLRCSMHWVCSICINRLSLFWSYSRWGSIRFLIVIILYRVHLAMNEYTSPWTGFRLTTLVVMGTDCTGSCKSNYHTITTTTTPSTQLNIMINTQPSIHVDASYQVSVHLARQFQRRRFFRYWPIRNKNCLWLPCLVMDQNKMCTL
jgi:hypothetical protein